MHPPPPHPLHNSYKNLHELQTVKIIFSFAWAEIQAKEKKSSKFIFIHEIWLPLQETGRFVQQSSGRLRENLED